MVTFNKEYFLASNFTMYSSQVLEIFNIFKVRIYSLLKYVIKFYQRKIRFD